jgi:hypothetical protein
MPFRGFEGPAGTGKTHQLIEEVGHYLAQHPLEPYQRVLALTFMHGSRKRLDGRFRDIAALRGRATCMTIDSFAQSVLQRWCTFAAANGLQADGFDQTCDTCGELLEDPVIAEWVARTFPVIVVDEAQELKPERLRILKALAPHVALFVAADEFQCLDEGLDTAPFIEWFATGRVEALNVVHRTGKQGLLRSGIALRNLQSPQPGDGLRIENKFPNVMPFAVAASLARAAGSKALIYGPSGRGWADEVIARAAQGMQSPSYGTIPPLRLIHEDRNQEEKQTILAAFEGMETVDTATALAVLAAIADPPPWVSSVSKAIVKVAQTQGGESWSVAGLTDLVERKAAHHRAYGYQRTHGIPVMSIHQAKNRQFDHVVLLWPPGVMGSDEQKARLLYNGITRAVQNCHVFVRTQPLLNQAPFRF